jgi:hypothetical protein
VTEVAALRNVMSPAPRGIWQAVFDRDVEAVPYQAPQWTGALCRGAHRRDRSKLYIFDDGADGAASRRVPVGSRRRGPGGFDAVWHGRL